MARRVLFAVAAYAVLALVVVGWGWLLTHPLRGRSSGSTTTSRGGSPVNARRWLDPVAEAGTLLGETPVGLAVGAVVAVVAGLLLRSFAGRPARPAGRRRGRRHLLARLARRPARPAPGAHPRPGLVPDHSFPSGHVGTAVAVYGGAALLLAFWLRSRGRVAAVRRLVVALLACVPLFVAASRLYQGAHHLTDVGTSLVYGAVWLAVLAALLLPRSRARRTCRATIDPWRRDTPVPHR